jgi:protein-tyrosine phosphatase
MILNTRAALEDSQPISGALNFRHLGGYVGEGGRAVVPQRLFRSDHLGALTSRDRERIRALGLTRVLDLRGIAERAAAPCVLDAVAVHSLSIEPTIVQVLTELIDAGHQLTAEEVVGHMQETYRGFVGRSTHRFAQLFAHLLESNEPTVFHCTAGKDRTGFAAALILRSLGVHEEDVMRDYLLTNERLKLPGVSRHGLAPEVAMVLSRVQPAFLQAAFEAVERDYGGLDAYFREGLRLGEPERRRLQELYLEPARR